MRYKPCSFEPLYKDVDTASKIPEIVYMGDVHGEYTSTIDAEFVMVFNAGH